MATIVTDNSGYVYYAFTYAWTSGGGCDPEESESEIVMKKSSNHGASWSSGYYLTDYGGQRDDILPALAPYGGGTNSTLHFAWTNEFSDGSEDYDVRYKKITNAGGTPTIPSGDVTISFTGAQEFVVPGGIAVGPDNNPQITYIYSVAATGNGDIRYRRSNDGGTTFEAYQAISERNTEETDPRIAVDDKNNPVIVWRDARAGNTDIYLTYSDDQGQSWRGEFLVNKDVVYANQNWPWVALWSDGWRKSIAVTWWDLRYDEGDVYFNGNDMVGVSMDVDYIPSIPATPRPGFSYRAFETIRDTTFDSPGVYQVWFDPEYANDPLIDEKWSGSSSTERWAIDNPGGWYWLSPSYFMPPDTGGEYECHYYHQFRTIFDALKGNPPACTHTIPNIDVEFESHGILVDTIINDAISCTAWVDYNTNYHMDGSHELSPQQRWATNSPDTLGSVSVARLIQPEYYHQWLPLVLFVGPTEGNTVFTEQHSFYGDPHLETGLWERWNEWTDCGSMVDFSDTTVPLGWYAIDSTWFTCIEYSARTIRYSGDTYVTIRNDFGFGDIEVDYFAVASPDTESWGPGSVHHIGAISPQSFGDTVRYFWDYWSDSGAIDHDITVPDVDITYTAYFNTQYKLDMTYSGETGGHVPSLTGEGWYWADSFATITASDFWDSTGGVRYGFSHWESDPSGAFFADSADPNTEVLIDKHYTVIAVYSVQYSLEVNSDGGYGYPDPPVGSNWFDAGSYVCVDAGSPDTVSHMYCWSYTGTGPVPSGSGDAVCFWMSSAGSITWHWDNQVTLEVISAYGLPTPSAGTHYFDPGEYIECSAPTPFYLTSSTRSSCMGYTGTSVIGSGSGNYVDFNIAENCTLTWNWQLQYSLLVVNPGGWGSPLPSEGISWHGAGTSVMARVLSPDPPMVCIGFNGTPPSLPTTSSQDSIVFNMIAPATLTWLWADGGEVYSLTVIDSGLGDAMPYGTTYYLPGSPINAAVTSPYSDPFDEELRWVCDSFDGTGSCPDGVGTSTGTWYIWSNSTLTWHWHQQYRLYIDSEPGYYGSPDPDTGAYWFEPGSWVEGEVTSPWEDSIVCVGFTGTGSAPPTSSLSSFGFNLDDPSSVLWHWDISAVSLDIYSDHGTPNPPVGSHAYAVGTELDLTINEYEYVSGTERWKCVGWIGSGDVPASGSDTTVHITLTENSSINWQWVKQFRLDVDNPGGYDTPVPAVGQHWVNDGEWATCYITTNPVDTMYCVGFVGSGSCPSEWGMDEVSFVVEEYSTLQWIWMGISDVESLTVSSEYGSPHPTVGVHYYPHGVLADCYITDCTEFIGTDERYRCVGYTGMGPAPSGSDTTVTFPMSSSGTLKWDWQHQYTFEVENPGGYGSPVPDEGEYWMEADTPVDAYITVNPDGGMVCTGYDGWGALVSGYGDSVHFDLTVPSGVSWNWIDLAETYELEVISPYGPCDPPIGINYIPQDIVITASAGPYNLEHEALRHRAVSYVGTGCVPSSDDTNAVTFTMTGDGTVTWSWIDEYYLALTYDGCGRGVPTQTGAGWYQHGDVGEVSSETPVDDGGTYYGFIEWIPDDAGAVDIAEEEFYTTTVTVYDACTLEAQYGLAVPCTLKKNPSEDLGGFVVDGVAYDSTDIYSDWWAVGSCHEIEATSPDSADGEKYDFVSWSDGGARVHAYGPVEEPLVLTANYLPKFRLRVQKVPAHTSGHIEVDGTVYNDSSRVELWFESGSTPAVGVSDIDYQGSDERYFWYSWSDGGAINHIMEPIFGPVDLDANYTQQYRLMVVKEPDETAGTITIDDSLYEFVSSATRWFEPGTEHLVEVSRLDIVGDSAYQFIGFNFVFSDTVLPRPVVLTEPESLIAGYRGYEYTVNLIVEPDFWDAGLLPANFTHTMIPDSIVVQNGGNVPIDLGLTLIMEDTLTVWDCGCINGIDRIVLRGHFSLNPLPPPLFNNIFDCVKDINTWSKDVIFGPEGWSIGPARRQKLWLQIVTPSTSSDYTEQVLILRVMARATIW